MKYEITASIVAYKNSPWILKESINSFCNSKLSIKLYVIDNSPDDSLKELCIDTRCEYIFNGKNLGFGKAHNIAIRRAVSESRYHIVLNPDIYFDQGEIEKLFGYMEKNENVGQIMPKILYANGDVQHLCKLLPAPADLFLRRFFPWFPGANARNIQYELRKSNYDKIMNVPYLSGCFMFFRTEALAKVGLFDERIFMYIEDADITRRMHKHFNTIYYPLATVYHHYAKGSYKSVKLMLYNIHGAFIYFMKWGWFFDKERIMINKKTIDLYLNEGSKQKE